MHTATGFHLYKHCHQRILLVHPGVFQGTDTGMAPFKCHLMNHTFLRWLWNSLWLCIQIPLNKRNAGKIPCT